MLKINNTPKLFNLDKVEAVAAALREGDPEWAYVVRNGDGSEGPYASIEVFDEDGISLGLFSDA